MHSAADSDRRDYVIEEEPLGDLPADDEFEVTVFGRGVGECIALHIGSGHWCLVDSFRHPVSREPAALRYLRERGVGSDQVALIVGTHFHMDHVAALSECVEACGKARIVLPQAQFPDEVLAVLQLEGVAPEHLPRRLQELKRIVDVLKHDRHVRMAGAGTNILPQWIASRLAGTHDISPVFMSLSPSDATTARIRRQWTTLLATPPPRRTSRLPHNETSMVLVVSIGSARVLLAADLEDSPRDGEGWRAVDEEWPRSQVEAADVLKVPHHGSYNADSDYLWRNLSDNPLGIVAPFNSGRTPVPRAGDLSRLRQKCSELFGTSMPRTADPATDGPAAEILAQVGYRPLATEYGAVRLRRTITDDNGPWRAAFFGAAGIIPPFN